MSEADTRLDRFLAGRHSTTTVLDRGVLVHEQWGRVPAARLRNAVYGQTWVWAYTGSRRKEKAPTSWENHIPDATYLPGATV